MVYNVSDQVDYNISHKIINTTVTQFPLSLIVNYTVGGKNSMQNLTFTSKTTTDVADNGAAFDILLSNPKRKRLATSEAWFDFDYWSPDGMTLNYEGPN